MYSNQPYSLYCRWHGGHQWLDIREGDHDSASQLVPGCWPGPGELPQQTSETVCTNPTFYFNRARISFPSETIHAEYVVDCRCMGLDGCTQYDSDHSSPNGSITVHTHTRDNLNISVVDGTGQAGVLCTDDELWRGNRLPNADPGADVDGERDVDCEEVRGDRDLALCDSDGTNQSGVTVRCGCLWTCGNCSADLHCPTLGPTASTPAPSSTSPSTGPPSASPSSAPTTVPSSAPTRSLAPTTPDPPSSAMPTGGPIATPTGSSGMPSQTPTVAASPMTTTAAGGSGQSSDDGSSSSGSSEGLPLWMLGIITVVAIAALGCIATLCCNARRKNREGRGRNKATVTLNPVFDGLADDQNHAYESSASSASALHWSPIPHGHGSVVYSSNPFAGATTQSPYGTAQSLTGAKAAAEPAYAVPDKAGRRVHRDRGGTGKDDEAAYAQLPVTTTGPDGRPVFHLQLSQSLY